jgi:CHAT domain-containing protein/Tfp pilus assembly protein PilF
MLIKVIQNFLPRPTVTLKSIGSTGFGIALMLLYGSGAMSKVNSPGLHRRAALATSSVQVQEERNIQMLALGVPVEREMAGEDTHVYLIQVNSGEYLHVVVDQRGIDVLVRLVSPDGRQVSEIDSPNGMNGPEPISLVADSPGAYRLEVVSYDRKAPAGRYEVRVVELRAATANDRLRIAAERAYFEGQKLSEQGTEEARRKSIVKYFEALPIWRALGNRLGEADALYSAAYVYDLLAEERQSLNHYSQALQLYESLQDLRSVARTLSSMGEVYSTFGEKQKALEYLERALHLRQVVADRAGEAYTLNNLGTFANDIGKPQKGFEYLSRSVSIAHSLGERKAEAYAHRGLGIVYYTMGEDEDSLREFNLALDLSRDVGDSQLQATCLHNIGSLYNSSGNYLRALDLLNQALVLRRTTGDRNGQAFTLNQLGAVYDKIDNKRREALVYYEQALPITREVDDRQAEAQTLYYMGKTYNSLGEREKAFEHFGQALRLFRLIRDVRGEAFALEGIARAERDSGDLTGALSRIESAIDLIEQLRDGITGPDWRSSFTASGRELYELEVNVLMELHRMNPGEGYMAKAFAVSERARARSLFELLAEQRAGIPHKIDPTLVERERALGQLLKDKAEYQMRLLSSSHTPGQAAAADEEIARLKAEHQEVMAKIRAMSPHYAELLHLQSQPITLPVIQKDLQRDDTVLLEYFLGEEKSYLWLVSGSSLDGFELPGREGIETTASTVIGLLAEHGTAEEFEIRAANLSRILLGPAAAWLGRRRLVFVTDGVLEYLPFATLPAPEASASPRRYMPLVIEHEVINLPSASIILALRTQLAGRAAAPKQVAVLADPVFRADDARVHRRVGANNVEGVNLHNSASPLISLVKSGVDFKRLLGSRTEAELILSLVPRGSALAALDFEASIATAMSARLRDYKIVHFATHGFFNPTRPELSGLVLSLVDKNGSEQKGFLSIPQVFDMSLRSDLVVLSGCQTGLGKQVKGEGLIALTRGFMYAGSPRVVSSLWAIPDDATAQLMGRFYRAMLRNGLRPGAALREAQVSMIGEARWGAPHQWGGFVINGDWR